MRLSPAWVLVFGVACAAPAAHVAPTPGSGPIPASGPPPSSPKAPTPPAFRLPDGASPKRYDFTLSVRPHEPRFQGTARIEVHLATGMDVLWLHARDLEVKKAAAVLGASTRELRVFPAGELLGLALEGPLPAGDLTLVLEYDGALSDQSSAGLFRVQEGGRWYAFTEFEPLDARAAFPCFDEPQFKVPWKLTLKVPADVSALSNMPVVSESGEGPLKVVSFAESPPMPSYLWALAVGPFSFTEVMPAGTKKVPLRVVTPHGRAAEAGFSARTAAELLERLEQWFGSPYPYPKLDLLAVPLGIGAMENPGLVTFAAPLLLAKPGDEARATWQRTASVFIAHELAHMWFGNLVTMRWWDDLWLNESFAMWMETKLVAEWKPEWDLLAERAHFRARPMLADGLTSARRIRQPVDSQHDVLNAFDGITYGKGELVLRMFEAWLGPEVFREGVRDHLAHHAWKSATADDFFAALSRASKKDVAPLLSSFLDQPGIPLVSSRLRCEPGKPPVLELAQRRFRPMGAGAAEAQLWKVPLCVRHATGKTAQRECTVLDQAKADWTLSASGCPTWVLPNAGGTGYYHLGLEAKTFRQLLETRPRESTAVERVTLLVDLAALTRGGDLELGEALAVLPKAAQSSHRLELAATASIVEGLEAELTDEQRPRYARLVRSLYGKRARALGLLPRPAESYDVRLLRGLLVPLVTRQGGDERLLAEATGLARKWLEDPKALPAEAVDDVLAMAAFGGDLALFQAYTQKAAQSEERALRERLFSAMAAFRDPECVKARLSLLLSGRFDLRETWPLLFRPGEHEPTRRLHWSFVKDNYAALFEKVPAPSRQYLIRVGATLCDQPSREDVASFFGAKAQAITGGPRSLAQALERIDQCVALRQAHQPSLTAFLEQY